MRESDLRVASVRRRSAARAIDLAIVVPPVIGLYRIWVDGGRRSLRLPDPSRRWQLGWWLLTTGGAVRGRNSRTLGARVMRLRYVDARTGGAVSMRSALIRSVVRSGWLRVASHLTVPSPTSAAIGPLLLELPVQWARRHQTLPERLAGIVLVVED